MENTYLFRKEGFPKDGGDLLVDETLFHSANGYQGVRACFEEGYAKGQKTVRGQYINGFYDIAEMKQAENLYGFVTSKQALCNTVETQTICMSVGDEPFDLFTGKVLSFIRELDMKKGVARRIVRWEAPSGRQVELIVTRMASFAMLPLFTIEYAVTPLGFGGDFIITSEHSGSVRNYCNPDDPRAASESVQNMITDRLSQEDGLSVLEAHTSVSGLRLVSAVGHHCSKEVTDTVREKDETLSRSFIVPLKENETFTLTKYTVLSDSRHNESYWAYALSSLREAMAHPLSYWYERQEEYLRDFWENCRTEVEGDDELAVSVHYGQFALLQSVGKDRFSNLAAKGLSGEGYEGHYFWDTEMYAMPFFVLTQRDIARNLILYRYATLEKARDNARILGHVKGALFPWRTITGEECSGYYPSGTAQYHINGAVAYAAVSYYLLTGDLDFMAEAGAELLFETARLWDDLGVVAGGQFRLNDVTGPDEYTCLVNNNYYTNAMAKYNLHWAVKIYELLRESGKLAAVQEKLGLREEEVDDFRRDAALMFLPYDEKRDINPQDDSFLMKKRWDLASTPAEDFPLLLHYHPLHLYRYQVCKQADTVLAHFVLEDEQPLSTIRNSYAYYEKITTHDSSLSTCIFSIMAAKLGDMRKAYDYFAMSSKLDITNAHGNTGDGLHTANLGGTYMGIVYGFAGLRIKEQGLFFTPRLPKELTGYSFRFLYRDSRLEVEVRPEGATFRLLSGSRQTITVNGERFTVDGSVFIHS